MHHLLLLVIHLCIVGTLSQTVITGTVGQEITLPCTYSVQGGRNHMCWGRGSCPNSKCSNEILRTDGMRVTSRASSRYQLRGWSAGGDVSLTIANLKEGDKGMYCCRIEVPGWFNDLKKTLTLQVDRATTTTSRTTTTTSHTVPITTTSVPLITTVTPPTTGFPSTTDRSPFAVPTVPPLTTNIPPMTTSVKEAIEFSTSDPPLINISPSTPDLQTTYRYNYNFITMESEIVTSTAVTSSSPKVPAVALLPITHVSSTTTSSTSTLVALLTTSPLVNNTKSPSTSPQHECPENDILTTPEAVASSTGTARFLKMFSHNYVAVSCAVTVLVLLLVLLVLIIKRKNIRLYQINKTKSINKAEETEKVLIETEGENGIFAL